MDPTPTTSAVSSPRPARTPARAEPGQLLQGERQLAPPQHALVQRLSELDIAYHGSPIVEGAGKRYFDDSMRGGRGIGSRLLVVIGDDADFSTTEAARQLGESLRDIVELRSSRHPGLMLVRPDGYIAYAAQSRDGVPALASLRSVLERHLD